MQTIDVFFKRMLHPELFIDTYTQKEYVSVISKAKSQKGLKMTQKITLSIPDLLHEKLEEWRTSFNFSKMFQEAVTDAIRRKEDFQKRFSEEFDVSDIIKRLRQEKLNWEKQYYKKGKTEGLRWAKTAHFKNLLYVLQFEGTYQLISDPKMNQYFEKIYKSTDLAAYSKSESVDHERMFMDGWFKGVVEFWNQVKEKI
jgi:hypothetical protein